MTRLTLAIALTLAVLLLCGSPSQMQAQSTTKIVIKDAGSILLHADGLDAGKSWKFGRDEVRHRNLKGVLTELQITDGTADRCGGSATCGIDPSMPWAIQVAYGSGAVAIASVSENKGVRLTHVALPFDQWKPTANADEREYGHGDGNHITAINVNSGPNLCSGKGCQITVRYSPR